MFFYQEESCDLYRGGGEGGGWKVELPGRKSALDCFAAISKGGNCPGPIGMGKSYS